MSALVLAIAGCQPDDPPPPTPDVRGALLRIADAPQLDPPAIAALGDDLIAFWIGADERGVHHDARRITPAGMTPIVTLPLPPAYPRAQLALPSGAGAILFWLDQPPDAPEQAGLYAARMTGDLVVERGPVLLSEQPVYSYAVTPAADGGAWAAWSGGAPDEPTLYARRIDPEGRPLEGRALLADGVRIAGSFPALTYDTSGTRWLFWLARGQVWRGRLDTTGADITDVSAVTSALFLEAGDRIVRLRAGSDGRYGVLFWTIERANGGVEIWMTVGSFNDLYWAQPRRFTLDGDAVRYAAPLDTAASPLPIAVLVDGDVMLASMRDGQIGGGLRLTDQADMLRPPALTAGSGGAALWTAWAQPGADRAALMVLRTP